VFGFTSLTVLPNTALSSPAGFNGARRAKWMMQSGMGGENGDDHDDGQQRHRTHRQEWRAPAFVRGVSRGQALVNAATHVVQAWEPEFGKNQAGGVGSPGVSVKWGFHGPSLAPGIRAAYCGGGNAAMRITHGRNTVRAVGGRACREYRSGP
jgi:hypothetical protein